MRPPPSQPGGNVPRGAGLLFEVTRRGDCLLVQITGQAALPVFPPSERRFFHKAVGAQITFEAGPDGRAARLILHQNSRDQGAAQIGEGS